MVDVKPTPDDVKSTPDGVVMAMIMLLLLLCCLSWCDNNILFERRCAVGRVAFLFSNTLENDIDRQNLRVTSSGQG